MLCEQTVPSSAASWQCRGCWLLAHLTCAQKTAATTLTRSAKLVGELLGRAALSWSCPHCSTTFSESEYPGEYRCFCGKTKDPRIDPWLAPHACGQLCGQERGCGHKCTDRCHAGPCQSCSQMCPVPCFCGKASPMLRCGAPASSCGQSCGRKGVQRWSSGSNSDSQSASAGQAPAYLQQCDHACGSVCHSGRCPPCTVIVEAPCVCGSERRRMPCVGRVWRCGRPCSKMLACGRHPCPLGCHTGPCPPCPNAERRSCGCGKSSFPDLPCDAPTPVCGDTCERKLSCGHECGALCHAGDCPRCVTGVSGRCRCGRTVQTGRCDEVAAGAKLKCSYRCEAMRNCGRHVCRRRCCEASASASASGGSGGGSGSRFDAAVGGAGAATGASSSAGAPPAVASAHVCRELCGSKLSCGIHTCMALCHAGPCSRCPITVTLVCPCGGTRKTFPCGRAPAAVTCNLPCQKPPLCKHPEQERHPCHAGPCPPCRQPCGAALSRCTHACPLACHSNSGTFAAVTAAASSSSAATAGRAAPLAAKGEAAFPSLPPAGGVDAAAGVVVLEATPCPPCTVPTERRCVGGHSTKLIPCALPALWRCDAVCGGSLPCGRHTCAKACHARTGAASADSGAASASCGTCDKPCNLARPSECSHPCKMGKCHTGDCPPCEARLVKRCHCGRQEIAKPCVQWQQLSSCGSSSSQGSDLAAGHSSAASDPLSCAARCGRSFIACAHTCGASCHAGPCDAAFDCAKGVTVRCRCGGVKAEWPCRDARLARASAGGAAARDPTNYTLLPCDSEVCKATASKGAAAGAHDSDDDDDDDFALSAGHGRMSAEAHAAAKAERAEARRRRKAAEQAVRDAARAADDAKAAASAAAAASVAQAAAQRRMLMQAAAAAAFGVLVLWLLKTALGY